VLPTGDWAKTAPPLSEFDFMKHTKHTSIGHVTRDGNERLALHDRTIARYEGLDAHADAVSDLRNKLLRI
jgi:histidinol dehydrogenase